MPDISAPGCHVHGFAWTCERRCTVNRLQHTVNHAHAKPWAWHRAMAPNIVPPLKSSHFRSPLPVYAGGEGKGEGCSIPRGAELLSAQAPEGVLAGIRRILGL